MPSVLRPRSLGAIFGAYFAIIFFAAWYYSKDFTTSWYGADLSFKVYAAYLIAAAALLVGLGGIAVGRSQFLDRRIVELNDRIEQAGAVDASMAAAAEGLPPPLPEPKDHVDRDIDDLLESLSEMESTTAREAEAMEAAPAGEIASAEGEGARPMEWDLAKKLERVRRMRRAIPRYVAGPAAVSIVVAGVSGIMVPAVEGFLQGNGNFNTALILSFSYWWPGLGAYVLAAVYGLLKQR